MPHAVAGGFLSDSYMLKDAEYGKQEQFTSRDIDVFMQVPADAFIGVDIDTFLEEIHAELKLVSRYDWDFPTIRLKKYEKSDSYDFISMAHILYG